MTQTINRNSPVFIGADVIVEGKISRKDGGDPNDAAVITGVFKGNIDWPGVVLVSEGAEVIIDAKVSCREIDVAGKISGGENVELETGLLRTRASATVEVGLLSLPPGGLEQARGAVVNANLRMSKEHPYAGQQPQQPAKPALTVVNGDAPLKGDAVPQFLMATPRNADTPPVGEQSQSLSLNTGTGTGNR